MILFDAMLRGGILATITLVVIALLKRKEAYKQAETWLILGFGLTYSAYVIATSALPLSGPARLALRVADAPNFALLWLLLLAVYSDRPVGRWPDITIAAGYTVLMLLERVSENAEAAAPTVPPAVFLIATLSLIAHACLVILQGRVGDLVEWRRASRLIVFLVIVGAAIVSTWIANTSSTDALASLPVASALIACITVGAFWINVDPAKIGFATAPEEHQSAPELTDRQTALLQKLSHIMEVETAYLESDITIASLAQRLGVGEHTLRKLINQGLGYRNFARFLNEYRVAFAKRQLDNPEVRANGLLNLAMDAGYNSLSAFNRAFRDVEGMTPSEYSKPNSP